MSITAFIPVQPGRRGQRGISHATTRRLKELQNYYSAKAIDQTVDAGFRRYATELAEECAEEIRLRDLRRGRRSTSVAA